MDTRDLEMAVKVWMAGAKAMHSINPLSDASRYFTEEVARIVKDDDGVLHWAHRTIIVNKAIDPTVAIVDETGITLSEYIVNGAADIAEIISRNHRG